MYLLVPFILKKFEKFLELIQGYKDVPFSGPKWPICPEQNFFGTNHYYYFHLPIGIYLIQQNLQKFLQQIQSYEDGPFLGPKWSICPPPPKKFFFGKLLILFSSTYQHLLLCRILKNSFSRARVMRMYNVWAQNGPFPQMRIFSENLLMSLVSFIHACLHAKNQS